MKNLQTSYNSLTQLNRRITTDIRVIDENIPGNVLKKVEERLNAVTRENSGHIEQM